jgi:hypothetical protein
MRRVSNPSPKKLALFVYVRVRLNRPGDGACTCFRALTTLDRVPSSAEYSPGCMTFVNDVTPTTKVSCRSDGPQAAFAVRAYALSFANTLLD